MPDQNELEKQAKMQALQRLADPSIEHMPGNEDIMADEPKETDFERLARIKREDEDYQEQLRQAIEAYRAAHGGSLDGFFPPARQGSKISTGVAPNLKFEDLNPKAQKAIKSIKKSLE